MTRRLGARDLKQGKDYRCVSASDGEGGIWYVSEKSTFVHRTAHGTVTSVAVPVPKGRRSVSMRAVAHVPGGTTTLSVCQVAPVGPDESWDALIERYGG